MTRPPRVLLIAAPNVAGGRANGAAMAADELAHALERDGLATPTRLELDHAISSAGRAKFDVVHAIFAPRIRTGVALRALSIVLRAPVVRTIASRPRFWSHARASMAGDAVVATSLATRGRFAELGLTNDHAHFIRMPFVATPTDPLPKAPRELLLFAGDLEHGDAVEPLLAAFSRLADRDGSRATLGLAYRLKTPKARTLERQLRARIQAHPRLSARVVFVGEPPSLLPWIAAARAVLLPANDSYAKLDHPRVLLEALSLGVPIIVGTAPPFAELIADPSFGEVAHDVDGLYDAMERVLVSAPPSRDAVATMLADRAPSRIAAEYRALYDVVIRQRHDPKR